MQRYAGFVIGVTLAIFSAACAQTDAGITTSVKTKLASDDTVKAYMINVDTNDHIVTLRGQVDSTEAKEQALRIARSTDGVQTVIDELRVSETAATSGTLDGSDLRDDIERGVDATGRAIEKGAKATVDATRSAGRKVRDAVTDKDRDSDRDGK